MNMQNISIRGKMMVIVAVFAFSILASIAYTWVAALDKIDKVERLKKITDIAEAVDNIDAALGRYAETAFALSLSTTVATRQENYRDMSQQEKLVRKYQQEHDALESDVEAKKIRNEADAEIESMFKALSQISVEEIGNDEVAQKLVSETIETHYRPAILAMGKLADKSTEESSRIKDEFKASLITMKYHLLVAGLLTLFFGFSIATTIARRQIATPIKIVSDALQVIARGDDVTVHADFGRQDEIGVMQQATLALQKTVSEAFRLKKMVDDMPTNVMTVDANNDFRINYVNNTSLKTLGRLAGYLNISVDDVIGQSVDVLQNSDTKARRVLVSPDNLPWRDKIVIGPEKIQQQISAINDKNGNYIGAMLTWEIITAKESMAANVGNVVNVVSSAVTELEATAKTMSALAVETQSKATAVAAAAEEASANVATVAASTEELNASIAEISQRVQQSAQLASAASGQAENTNRVVSGLKQAAGKIGEVINLINDIADQTNLLALNATIEAARAGDAGKGFAVVASEVKNLASQTAKATEEIRSQIANMQDATQTSVTSIQEIVGTIAQLNAAASGVAAAVEEQSAATQEIARNVEQAAAGTREVTINIVAVSQGAQETGNSATEVLVTAQELSKQSNTLQTEVSTFLQDKA